MAQLSDVALALELQAFSRPDRQDVTVIRTKARHNRRMTASDEEWQRGGFLGEGGYGRVYLEECISGSSAGKIRAVKKLVKARSKEYHHELNAIALFSLGKVRRSQRIFGFLADCVESIEIALYNASVGILLNNTYSCPWSTFHM
jgi:hypothetical protein